MQCTLCTGTASTHWLRPRTHPLPSHLGSYTRALRSAKIDGISLGSPLGKGLFYFFSQPLLSLPLSFICLAGAACLSQLTGDRGWTIIRRQPKKSRPLPTQRITFKDDRYTVTMFHLDPVETLKTFLLLIDA
jgi:hypothetical protein